MKNPFLYFNNSPEIIRLLVMMYVLSPFSLRQVEDLLFERSFDICHETVRFWRDRFRPMSPYGYERLFGLPGKTSVPPSAADIR
tara:strand:+ start:4646 stop:4897 length:252 start_codon:yes stop_codon:yes gene_type:complete